MRTRVSRAVRKSDIRDERLLPGREASRVPQASTHVRFAADRSTTAPVTRLAPPGRSRRATSILPRGSGIVGVWLLVHRPRELRLPRRSPAARSVRSATAGSRRCGRSASCSATARACRSSRRCRGRSPAGAPRGVGGGPLVRRATIGTGVLAAVLVGRRARSPGRGSSTNLFDDEVLLLVGLDAAARRLRARVPGAGRARRELAVRALRRAARRRKPGSRLLVTGRAGRGRRRRPRARTASCSASRRSSGCSSRSRRRDGLVTPGPPAPWRELSRAFGWLLAGSIFAQALVNTGPILVQLLAPGNDDGDRSVPREPRDRAHPGVPLPRRAGRAAAAPRRPRRRGAGARPRSETRRA